MFKLGYNTNGFASHSLLSAIDVISSQGYQSIAITIDHHSLNPFDAHFEEQLHQVKEKLAACHLSSIIETGARFLLNPMVKHDPTLVSETAEQRNTRIRFIQDCILIASQLQSDAVSVWSGQKPPDINESQAWEWLVQGCRTICRSAAETGILIAFEPEPGMMIENMAQFLKLKQAVGHPAFKLTLDLGHAFITEQSVPDTLKVFKEDIINIHLEDMKKDVHDHLFFGEGEMDFKEIFDALQDIGYSGQVNVELSRHSHDAVTISGRALHFLRGSLSNIS